MEKQQPPSKEQAPPKREESGGRKGRLKDLNVKEEDGGFVKGGVPKQPDTDVF